MKREIIETRDGSHSISIPEMHVTYHSVHGAVQESKHVFIEAGLSLFTNIKEISSLNIFEMGFGTGLNALLTLAEAEKHNLKIYYETVELFPLDKNEVKQLNYCEQIGRPDLQPIFEKLHDCEWEKPVSITDHFTLVKKNIPLIHHSTNQQFNLIYYDAFAPSAQHELWTKEIFINMFYLLKEGGIIVTYCSKSDVRRAMQAAGIVVEKIPGPLGKREMVRGRRVNSRESDSRESGVRSQESTPDSRLSDSWLSYFKAGFEFFLINHPLYISQ